MDKANPPLKAELLRDLFLLKRETAVAKVNALFDGQTKEVCLRTVFPKQLPGFVTACLSQRGELESGIGTRCFFVGDRQTWLELCKAGASTKQILIATDKLDFEEARDELLPLARSRQHAVIYSLVNPRPDQGDVVTLNEPKEYDVREVLKKHGVSAKETERLARQSNGNVFYLTCLLTSAGGRPSWANAELGYQLRCLTLIGGWNDASPLDCEAVAEIVGEPYKSWAQRVYPLTKRDEPPALLDGRVFKPISRYENWQQLARFLTDDDIARFQVAAVKILQQPLPELELPREKREFAGLHQEVETYSEILKENVAQTLALMGAKGHQLPVSPNLSANLASDAVGLLLHDGDWKRWASLNSVMPALAEAAPSRFLAEMEHALIDPAGGPLKEVFASHGDLMFGRHYHTGVLWALESLAWSPDHLSRVATVLAKLGRFPLPENLGNNPVATLRAIFLTWLPQTLASVEARKAAVECVIAADAEIGWKLLLGVLPEGHQMGHYNQKPRWRDDWFPEDWSEGVTRAEMLRQVRNYAELAVRVAMNDIDKLTEIIARWDHLPREVFQKVLDYLESPDAKKHPSHERFALWQKLADEVYRHRKFADADWAMPDEELQRLDRAAAAIKPDDPAIVHQRLFNAYDHDFYTGDDYDTEAKKVAQMRTDAAADILAAKGPDYFVGMAASVKLPSELGGALGRMGDSAIDAVMIAHLLDVEKPTEDLVAGYIWSRYFKATIEWVHSINMSLWASAKVGQFFSRLPFVREVWRLAEIKLGDHRSEYWTRIFPNPHQAGQDKLEAATKALENGRADIAVGCVNAMRYDKMAVPTSLAVSSIEALLKDPSSGRRIDQHGLIEAIKFIQRAPDADVDKVIWIEYQCLPLLDRFSEGRPVFLERQLANHAGFFHDVVKACFRSEHDAEKKAPIDDKQKEIAEKTFPLLYNWRTPPGTARDGVIDENSFATWFAEVRSLCEASGHWAIAQQMIGKALMYPPAGLAGIIGLPVVAKTLDAPEQEHVRIGLRMELFNSRGVHGYSAGKDELKLAENYREHAAKYDLAAYPRIATMLRGLAESYERDAERESKRDPFGS